MICICCGLRIAGEYHIIEQGHLCERCWNDPNLFFPEKLKSTGKWDEIYSVLGPSSDTNETLKFPVIRLFQKGVKLYTGKLNAKNLIRLYAVFGFEEENLRGYQRELYDNKVNELYQYLVNCPIAIMPGIFISLRHGVKFVNRFDSESDEMGKDFGTLEVPMRKGAIWIIDGQHRIGGFEKALTKFGQIKSDTGYEEDPNVNLMDYELPVTFIDSTEAVELVNDYNGTKVTSEDIERVAFFIINKTQKRISPSLRDTLQYCITRSGMNGIPVIDRELWRSDATSIIIDLNALENSPLYNKINISGQRGMNRPIQLNSFVSSLNPLYKKEKFSILNNDEKKILLFRYWKSLRQIDEKPFRETDYRNYLLLKALGVYTVNLLILDYMRICDEENVNILDEINIIKFTKRLKGFDWSKETSPIKSFGGMKGVKEAHHVLINYMYEEKE